MSTAKEAMQIELIDDDHDGKISGVVIDVAGKRIEIGSDGVVHEQPKKEVAA